ncbi:putative pectate lyase 5, partial [Mucuna pruriens]
HTIPLSSLLTSTTSLQFLIPRADQAVMEIQIPLSFMFLFLLVVPSCICSSPLEDPELVVEEVQKSINASRRNLAFLSCVTGNPIDDCWRCDQNWEKNRKRLADCAIGFGKHAIGGRDGKIYVVSDPGDDPVKPKPGTLRYGVIQEEPLWIIFKRDMVIKLKQELMMNSFKTIDGRGASVHIAGGPCITIQYVSNVIIHGINIHDCKQGGNAYVRDSPTHYGWRTLSDGDGVSIFGGSHVWVDHCSLSNCRDGLIDAIHGSTAITISNNYMTHHNKVMLLGHSDTFTRDKNMQVTIAFNHFGEGLVQRMPRCRHGYFHVVNNDYTQWRMYAIGGSAAPTINSQGNRFLAPNDNTFKEVTKRENTPESKWKSWNWRSTGDMMLNGAFFRASGGGASSSYARASSLAAKPSSVVSSITASAGSLLCRKDPEFVVQEVQKSINGSLRRKLGYLSCGTGNPIDDCWRCDPKWERNRKRLASCGIGFGKHAIGGKYGKVYVVSDPSDEPVKPKPGTLRHAVIQHDPLWIIFKHDMVIKLRMDLLVNSYKTIDGRGANVHLAGGPCIKVHNKTNIIIHGLHIHHCKRGGGSLRSDGDGITIFAGTHVWVDHCTLSNCFDGLIDVVHGSTAITISNNYMTHHNKVMLLGHSDSYKDDKNMQVTIAFNRFGEGLGGRMPRCRFGYFHVVNNDYTHWQQYAIGGSSSPTIFSQGNRFIASNDEDHKEVTKHFGSSEREWRKWNWRSEGDLMLNGAYFTASGGRGAARYDKASSMGARPPMLVPSITAGAGALSCKNTNLCH